MGCTAPRVKRCSNIRRSAQAKPPELFAKLLSLLHLGQDRAQVMHRLCTVARATARALVLCLVRCLVRGALCQVLC
jgi:hypothetical protein